MGSSYAIFDWNGKEIYRPNQKKEESKQTASVPFLVKVNSPINIRKGASFNYPSPRKCPVGIYTIVQVSDDGEWGRLKSGAGWIWLKDPYCSIMGSVGTVQKHSEDDLDKLAKEVISGKWGNGSARKKALTEAGHDYNAVQKRVNELMS